MDLFNFCVFSLSDVLILKVWIALSVEDVTHNLGVVEPPIGPL